MAQMILHFGFEQYLGLGLYGAGILAFLVSIFWRPLVGLCYLAPLIPLQTTRYRMMEFPFGATLVSIILLGVMLGLLRRRQWPLPWTPWTVLLSVYALFTFATLFLDGNHLSPRLKEWWDYMTMPLLFLLVAATVKDIREMKLLVLLMCLSVFLMDKSFWNTVADRDYSRFSRDLQEGGSMGYAGVQGMAAFNAQFCWVLVALAGAKQWRVLRWAYLALGLFAANCVMYSFSRGGYAAFLAGWLFIGLVKYRKLLVVLVLFGMTWASVVPPAVRERVLMTYNPNEEALDHSAGVRLQLWTDALDLFQENPLVGTGFNTYAYMKRVGIYEDTHNIYLKVLVETGLIGLALFLGLLGLSMGVGLRLFRRAREPFFSALGLGLAVWIVCAAVANLFGDRWTYFQISGYFWVLAGLVSKARVIDSTWSGLAPPLTATRAEPELTAA